MGTNLRSGPILAVLIDSLWRLSLKVGPDTNSHKFVLTDFGRNADWLLEQCHKIWLDFGIKGSWKRLFPAWLFSWMIRRRRREGSIFLSFLLFYGLMVGKYASNCALEIQKIKMLIHIFVGFALFAQLMWVYHGVASLCKVEQCAFWFTNKRVQSNYKLLSILNLFYLNVKPGTTSLNGARKWRLTAKEKLNRQLWSIRRKTSHRCTRNFYRHYHKS